MLQAQDQTERISIHALREEGDRWPRLPTTASGYFYPRPPRGGRQKPRSWLPAFWRFLSTPSARRATLTRSNEPLKKFDISIHALREEGDCRTCQAPSVPRYFYPRPPRGGRPSAAAVREMTHEFLSTPSARRATKISPNRTSPRKFLSTPSARRATGGFGVGCRLQIISIHALREEGDNGVCFKIGETGISIHALREEGDPRRLLATWPTSISIHALREEGDAIAADRRRPRRDFYPRPPRGGRLHCW